MYVVLAWERERERERERETLKQYWVLQPTENVDIIWPTYWNASALSCFLSDLSPSPRALSLSLSLSLSHSEFLSQMRPTLFRTLGMRYCQWQSEYIFSMRARSPLFVEMINTTSEVKEGKIWIQKFKFLAHKWRQKYSLIDDLLHNRFRDKERESPAAMQEVRENDREQRESRERESGRRCVRDN